MTHAKSLALLFSFTVMVSACGKKDVETLPPPPGYLGDQAARSTTSTAPGSQADFVQRMSGRDVIFFDTDRFNIDSADIAALQTQADWLKQYPNKRAVIQGHADERGTREYNLALGERRANAAKNYLTSLGIEASRLSVVSFGKERPAAVGSDENSWAQNRRAVTVTID